MKERLYLAAFFEGVAKIYAVRRPGSEKLYLVDYENFDRLVTTIGYEHLLWVVERLEGHLTAYKLDKIRRLVQDESAFSSYLKWKRRKDRIKRLLQRIFLRC